MIRGRSTLITGIAMVLAVLMLLLVVFLLGRRSAGGQSPMSSAGQAAAATQAPTAQPTQGSGAVPTARSTSQGGGQPTPIAPTGQTITAFNIPTTFNCGASPGPAGYLVHLSWTTVNTTGVTISIDGPGAYASYPASASADVPFACSETQHMYMLTTHGSGTPASKTVVVKRA